MEGRLSGIIYYVPGIVADIGEKERVIHWFWSQEARDKLTYEWAGKKHIIGATFCFVVMQSCLFTLS